MTLDILTIPCLTDNYAFLIHNSSSGQTAVVDVPDANPVKAKLQELNWTLNTILITHHHADHIDGVEELRNAYQVQVIGHSLDKHRLPKLDQEVSSGEEFDLCGKSCKVISADGHTVGHIAYVVDNAAFTGDSLMALGCGRLFEGTPEMMWNTLNRIADLPDDTIIYSGHEYTAANAEFALHIDPDNSDLQNRFESIKQTRASRQPTVPSELSLEKATNPFLRSGEPSIKNFLGMENESDLAVFAEIRARKDRF